MSGCQADMQFTELHSPNPDANSLHAVHGTALPKPSLTTPLTPFYIYADALPLHVQGVKTPCYPMLAPR